MPGFTKQAIKVSFMELLNEQPLNQISVRNIVERCGINRNSFYYHFQDIPALIEEIIKELFDALIVKYPNITSSSECFNEGFRYALENKKALFHIWNSVNRDILEKGLMRFCDYIVSTYLKTVSHSDISETDQQLITRFLKFELFGAYMYWMSTGMPEDAIEDVNRVFAICEGLSDDIIERCKNFEAKDVKKYGNH